MSPINPVPPLSDDDRRAGLDKALARRRDRADLFRRLRASEITLADVFARLDDDQADPDGRRLVGRTQLRSALLAVHGIGAARADRILGRLSLAPDRRLSSLSPQQRANVVDAVQDAVTGWR